MMKVLHCIETISSGRVEQRRLSIVKGPPYPEYEHYIICTDVRGPVADALRAERVTLTKVGTVPSVFVPERYQIAARVVEECKPDIIHGAIIEGYTIASVVGLMKRVPVVIMEETSNPQNDRWKGHLLSRAMAGLADHCVCVSPGVGRYLTDTLRIPERKVAVNNNAVDQPACGAGLRASRSAMRFPRRPSSSSSSRSPSASSATPYDAAACALAPPQISS